VIKADLQAVLNTLTEHDLQDAFKKWRKGWEWCILQNKQTNKQTSSMV
jgi:hypothetical protein